MNVKRKDKMQLVLIQQNCEPAVQGGARAPAVPVRISIMRTQTSVRLVGCEIRRLIVRCVSSSHFRFPRQKLLSLFCIVPPFEGETAQQRRNSFKGWC